DKPPFRLIFCSKRAARSLNRRADRGPRPHIKSADSFGVRPDGGCGRQRRRNSAGNKDPASFIRVRAMENAIRSLLTRLGTFAAEPLAFVIVALYGLAWATFGHIDWHGFATLATWLMTLFIQRAEHRDTQAIQAKLDELLRTKGQARDELT